MRNTLNGILIAGVLFSAPCLAHDDAYLDSHPTPHGGQVRMAGPYHMEVLTEHGHLRVYVTDHGGAAVATAGWKAQAIVLAGKQKLHYNLQPAGNNTLLSKDAVTHAAPVVMVLTVTPAAGTPQIARYTRI